MKAKAITENHLFQKAYSKGSSRRGKYVAVYILKDLANAKLRRADPLHRPLNRLGLTVGKKYGGAVERVRAKRLMRESYRLIEKEYAGSLKHGLLVVITARQAMKGASMPDVRADLVSVFELLGVLRRHEKEDVKE